MEPAANDLVNSCRTKTFPSALDLHQSRVIEHLRLDITIPAGGVYADDNDNPPGNHRQREDLRQDRQRLEQLRQRRDQEIREGDKHEAREYNEKIQDQKREIRRDQRSIYGNRDRRDHD